MLKKTTLRHFILDVISTYVEPSCFQLLRRGGRACPDFLPHWFKTRGGCSGIPTSDQRIAEAAIHSLQRGATTINRTAESRIAHGRAGIQRQRTSVGHEGRYRSFSPRRGF